MALISFCGLLTLQVGAAILAAIFFTLAALMLAANVFDYHSLVPDGWFPFSLVFMVIFAIGLVVAGALMFASSYTESRSLAIMSLILIIILICYWLVLCCFSLVSSPDHVDGICIETRCPESFWIGNLRYRRFQIPEDQQNPTKSTSQPTEAPKTPPPGRRKRQGRITTTPTTTTTGQSGQQKEEPSRYVFGLPMIGAIVLFIINLIFLLFSALVMYSWAQELDWADYYYDEDPEVVVVEDY